MRKTFYLDKKVEASDLFDAAKSKFSDEKYGEITNFQ